MTNDQSTVCLRLSCREKVHDGEDYYTIIHVDRKKKSEIRAQRAVLGRIHAVCFTGIEKMLKNIPPVAVVDVEQCSSCGRPLKDDSRVCTNNACLLYGVPHYKLRGNNNMLAHTAVPKKLGVGDK